MDTLLGTDALGELGFQVLQLEEDDRKLDLLKANQHQQENASIVDNTKATQRAE